MSRGPFPRAPGRLRIVPMELDPAEIMRRQAEFRAWALYIIASIAGLSIMAALWATAWAMTPEWPL